MMNKISPQKILQKYSVLFLLLLFVGCGDGETPIQSDSSEEPVPAEPVDAAPPEVLFTDADMIEVGEQSTVIIDRLIELVEAVPEDGSIYVSIYLFEYEPLVQALKGAHSRKVSLHIMIDGSDRSDNEGTAEQLSELGENVEIVRIYNNASASAINHNKFVLLPKVKTEDGMAENLVFQTSQNFTESGSGKIQDVTVLSDKDLYDAYLDYWQDMKALANVQMDKFNYREYVDAEAGITAYFYPKRKGGTVYGEDTIIEILEDIDDPASASVKIGMSAWTDSRSEILLKLEELLTEGAEIEVITKSNIGSEIYEGLENLAEEGAVVKVYNLSNSGPQKINMHSKFMMVEGIWNGEQTQVLVTGTQNFTMNALRNNNEATLLFENHEFFSQYENYFEELKALPGICCTASKL